MTSIGIYCCISPGTEQYAEFLRNTCEINKSGKIDINYKAVLSGESFLPDGFEFIGKTHQCKDAVSFSHGLCLEKCYNYCIEDYVVFADTDMAVLYPEWDIESINAITDKVAAFGTQFVRHVKRYKKFPALFYCMFKRDILKKCDPEWMPKVNKKNKIIKEKINDPYLAKALSVPFNSMHKKDTAWKLKESFYKLDYLGEEIPMYYQYDNNAILKNMKSFNNDYLLKNKSNIFNWFMHEFHWNKKLFATHCGAGRNRLFDSQEVIMWRNCIKEYCNSNIV